MKISIITVCFNAQDTIEETLISIANQSYKNFELIVINGASTDGTIEIINKYKDNITHFISEPDNGVYDAMNKGIKLATGDFLFFLNANDVFYNNNVLKEVADALEKCPSSKFLFGDVVNVAENKKTSKIRIYEKVKDKFYFINDNICHQSIFYHKSLFEEFGLYSDKYKIYADWDFNIKCLVKSKAPALYLQIPISNFQLGGISSNSAFKKALKKEWKMLIKDHYNEFRMLIFIEHFLRKNYFSLYDYLKNNNFFKEIFGKFISSEKFKLNITQI